MKKLFALISGITIGIQSIGSAKNNNTIINEKNDQNKQQQNLEFNLIQLGKIKFKVSSDGVDCGTVNCITKKKDNN